MKNYIFCIFCLFFVQNLIAQKPQTPTPSEIYFKMEKLNVLASAMYVAAHPDDENTRLITYLTHHDKAHTNYLSLTRGNGGQNLISNELGTDLGVIRTYELWNARKIDGGHQFFSTADDFGYSKNPKETFEKWDKESLLQQMVYMIRKEQPDIIINRFDHRSEGTTHGHHTASAQLSKEAFALANDALYKIENENKLQTWQPKRLFFNVSWFFFGSKKAFEKADKSTYIPLNIGVFYNQLGKNNQEIASLSRSQHQSQGFGDLSSRGDEIDYVELIDGEKLKSSNLFEGIDTSWNRIAGGGKVQPLVTQLINEYDFKDPSKSINLLTKIYTEIDKLPESIWKIRKQNEVKELIRDCAGLFLDFTANQPYTTPNEKVEVRVEVANRAKRYITLKDIQINNQTKTIDRLLNHHEVFYDYFSTEFTDKNLTGFKSIQTFGDFEGQFQQKNTQSIGIEINKIYFSFPIKIQYRYKDVVKGEIYEPFHVIRRISAQFKQPVYISNEQAQKASVLVSNYSNETINGKLTLNRFIEGWKTTREIYGEVPFTINANEQNKEIEIPRLLRTENQFSVGVQENHSKSTYTGETKWIDYQHIPLSYYIRPAETKVISFDKSLLKKQHLGYIMGAGDEIPQVLQNLGYQVDLIDLKSIKKEDLSKYETIILGIRAFNTEDELAVKNQWLFDYAQNGGTVIVQYVTNINLKTENIAPYPLKIGKTRVTDENAAVQFLFPNDRLLNKPFKISQKNFQSWIQEQGLYYADSYSEQFKPVFSSNDPNENPAKGGLVVASYGKGYYIYTGLSFFRQLPAGNTGALELFVNLIELKNDE